LGAYVNSTAALMSEITEVASLEQLHRSSPWWWLHCRNADCLHRTRVALVPYIIRGGRHAEWSAPRLGALREVRALGCWSPASKPGWFDHWLGAISHAWTLTQLPDVGILRQAAPERMAL